MPRRHPKEEKTAGPNPIRIAERRERRKARRLAKSPANGLGAGLLTTNERNEIILDRRVVKTEIAANGETPELAMQLRNLERELEHDREAREKAPARI